MDNSGLPPMRYEPPRTSFWQVLKKLLLPLGALFILLAKFKGLLIPILKFFPVILKTGGTMFITIWVYSKMWGWWFAAGFVLLILVHECGHLLAAKRLGLKVGAPVFIPFMGALIALKDAPKNAWVEAQVGIGGPLLGTLGGVVCYGLGLVTGNPLFTALAFSAFLLNLFNLAPIGFLDGGRIATAISPWLWLVGTGVIGFLLVRDLVLFSHLHFLLLLIFVFSLPRFFSLFRRKSLEEQRYFEVAPAQRWLMAGLYFGLATFLTIGMKVTHIRPQRPPRGDYAGTTGQNTFYTYRLDFVGHIV